MRRHSRKTEDCRQHLRETVRKKYQRGHWIVLQITSTTEEWQIPAWKLDRDRVTDNKHNRGMACRIWIGWLQLCQLPLRQKDCVKTDKNVSDNRKEFWPEGFRTQHTTDENEWFPTVILQKQKQKIHKYSQF